ncbi:ATP-grasp domain-containing protein [Kineosporia babensis]|uniref:ATP-grasp domain-containing protein n=1 Tax=Kineosporia babensis TaxID=499548 RepID=A0A9X1SVG2_9ACTN|nr:hypothetical protein [Kineosporia babensis]MCD5312805.1 hypothetical protein [Kineosporia babensis]
MIERLAWVSALDARGYDEDEEPALAALRSAGVDVEVVSWDDPQVQWDRYQRAVLRSTWDYARRLEDFRAWLERVSQLTDLRNPLPMVRWSLDKHYLAELEQNGVPVTPTGFAEPGQTAVFPEGEFVVKPAIGAGSRDAASYGPDEHELATAHVRKLHDLDTSVLVQPLLKSVAAEGEWALVFFGGAYSHAAGKRVSLPRASVIQTLIAPTTIVPHQADAEQLAVAQRAVDQVAARFGVPVYARVDLVRDDQGRSVVMELELVEPSLFLPHASSLELFVAALTRSYEE